jgi:hypothetical protein
MVLGIDLDEDRVRSADIFCQCNHCVTMSTPRESYCCRETIGNNAKFARRVAEKMKCVAGPCIVMHPSFARVVLDDSV